MPTQATPTQPASCPAASRRLTHPTGLGGATADCPLRRALISVLKRSGCAKVACGYGYC